jgi:hypothetical protein
MEKINTLLDLKNCIQQLEAQQSKDWNALKEEALVAYENLTPMNILKATFQKTVASPNLKNTLINAALSIGAGYLSKTLLVGNSDSPTKKVLGTLMQLGVSTVVSNNTNIIKLLAEKAIGLFQKKKVNTNI